MGMDVKMIEKVGDLELPKVFLECPVCHEEDAELSDMMKKEEVEAGKVRPEVGVGFAQMSAAILDPTKVMNTLYTNVGYAVPGVCTKCGAIYAKMITGAKIATQDLMAAGEAMFMQK